MADKGITLTLTSWQKHIIQDQMEGVLPDRNYTTMTIPFVDRLKWVTYRIPNYRELVKGASNLYLTDSQIKQVKAVLGADAKLNAVRISPGMVKSRRIVFE